MTIDGDRYVLATMVPYSAAAMTVQIFEDFGIRIVRENGLLIVEYDSGEPAGSHLVRKYLTDEQTSRAMQSEDAAYRVLLELDADPEIA